MNFIQQFFILFSWILLTSSQQMMRGMMYGVGNMNRYESQTTQFNSTIINTQTPINKQTDDARLQEMIRMVFRKEPGVYGGGNMNNPNTGPNSRTFNNPPNYQQDFNFRVQRNPDGRLDVVETPTTNQRFTNSESSSGGIIHFPTQPTVPIRPTLPTIRPTKQSQQIIEMNNNNGPSCSSGGSQSSFCEKVDDYPIDQVAKVIEMESNKFEAVFGEDLVPEIPEVSQRIDPGEESLCQSVERLIFPQAALTKDNNWSFIVNHENYTQGVRIEECSNAGKPCAMTDSFPNGYKTECKQKYIYRQMLGFTANGKVVKDLYRLPSCCKCILKFH